MSLKVGIVGLPNAGKSTLFNALLKKQAALAANYPFATIEPNVGIVPVPDARLARLAEIVKNDSGVTPPEVPTTIEFVDIAGLVEGAHKGEGLGNKFLAHIREVDMILHVVRAYEDADIVHTMGSVDPARDISIIETELALADLQTIENSREARSGSARQKIHREHLINSITEGLNNNIPARRTIVSSKEERVVRDLHLITLKPALYVFNVAENNSASSTQPTTHRTCSPSLPICAQVESDIAGLSEAEQSEYLTSIGLSESGLSRIITQAYDMLGLVSFLTMGEKEVRAWTTPRESTAPEAAGVIHTDFTKKFIKAEVIDFPTLDTLGSKKKAKDTGKLRLEGKDYIVHDGDVVEFKIGS